MLARLAEDLYWSGRYLERLQHTARVLDVTTETALTSPRADENAIWQRALGTLVLESTYRERKEHLDGAKIAAFCVMDTSHPGSISSLIRALRENVRQVRELISSELWESVNDLYLRFYASNVQRDLDEHPAQLYAFVKNAAHAIVGVAAETMSRDDATRFFELGINLERTGTTNRVIGTEAAVLDAAGDTGLEAWSPVLRVCAARDAFVRSGQQADTRGVLGLLLYSAVFPRSVRFAVGTAEEHVRLLLRGGASDDRTIPEQEPLVARRLGLLRGRLDFGAVEDLIAVGLAPSATAMEADLREIHRALAERFFHHAPGADLQVQEVRALEPDWRKDVR